MLYALAAVAAKPAHLKYFAYFEANLIFPPVYWFPPQFCDLILRSRPSQVSNSLLNNNCSPTPTVIPTLKQLNSP